MGIKLHKITCVLVYIVVLHACSGYGNYMGKRKLDCVIKESTETNVINKKSKLVDNAKKDSTDQSSYMLTTTELYSNKNIKSILLHHMQSKVIDINIFDYEVNECQGEQWNEQQKKLIKKLKFDLYQFKSSQLTEKYYIFGQKDDHNVITAASMIRFFAQDGGQAIKIIPLMDYEYAFNLFSQLNEDSMFNDIDISILSKRRSGILIESKRIDIDKFIEVIKLKINNIDNPVTIDGDIKKVIEAPNNNYKLDHQVIADKYKIDFQDNQGEGNYSSEEDEILDVIDGIKDAIESQAIVGQPITNVVNKSKKKGKSISWDISVLNNEGRTRNNKEVAQNDQEAIKIFERAVEDWNVQLFEQAKAKSNNFIKLVDYFNEEIQHEFWGHFYENCYYKQCFQEEMHDPEKTASIKQAYSTFILKTLDGYKFLMNNIPNIFDQFKNKQDRIIRDLPPDRQQNRCNDLLQLIKLATHHYTDAQLLFKLLNKTINAINNQESSIPPQDNDLSKKSPQAKRHR